MTTTKKSGFASMLASASLGAVMFSSYVGPGFASGTQTVQYFLTKGWIGVFLGLIVCGALALIVNLMTFEFNRVYRPLNYREQADLIYRSKAPRLIIGTFVDIHGFLTPIVSVAAQISACSLLLNNLWGLPIPVGTVLYCVIVIALALFGAHVVRVTGSFLTCAILAVTLYIGITGIPNAWEGCMQFIAEGSTPEDYGFSTIDAWYIMIVFMSNFLCGGNACVNASRGVLVTRKDVIFSAVTNIFLCVAATMVYTVVFAAGMPEIANESLPTLWAIQNLCGGARGAQIIYAVLAIAAMLSTGIALTFGVANRWDKTLEKVWKNSTSFMRQASVAILIILICTVGSTFGILNIVKYGFTYLAKISWPVLCCLPCFTIPWRIAKDKKEGLIGPDGYYIHADSLEKIAEEG